ncbi:MAG: flagellar basal body P-ring formation chaperone FlgA [Phycisphaerae bacterium]
MRLGAVVSAWAPVVLLTLAAGPAAAGTIRVWPRGLVVGDSVRLDDVAELRGFAVDEAERLAGLALGDAPPAGSSRDISIDTIRDSVRAAGFNPVHVTLSGATLCSVSRPARPVPTRDVVAHRSAARPSVARGGRAARGRVGAGNDGDASGATLRQAVIDHFNAALAAYGGRADLVFQHTSEQVLNLSGSPYSFRVRRGSGPVLGLVGIEVDVVADGHVVQTVPLVAKVTMLRDVVVARRVINQDATIRASDVEVVPMSFTRLERTGLADVAQVVGQRAKRLVPAGAMIEASKLEAVPLVTRGQLVTLVSAVGAVRVVTSAKATESGFLGDAIRVRSADKQRREYDAVVVGPAQVRIGTRYPGPRGVSPGSERRN